MTFFDLSEPIPANSRAAEVTSLGGALSTHLKRQAKRWIKVFSTIRLSELDQAFVGWGLAALLIFSLAQFSTVSWPVQAVLDASLTGATVAGTSGLTWQIAEVARLRWVVLLWAVLMSLGMGVTAYGIFCGVGLILINLCSLWLGLCALGYLAMAVGMRSRCFGACALVHGLAITGLTLHPGWQFFTSGLVMALTLFFFSIVPWDMREVAASEPC